MERCGLWMREFRKGSRLAIGIAGQKRGWESWKLGRLPCDKVCLDHKRRDEWMGKAVESSFGWRQVAQEKRKRWECREEQDGEWKVEVEDEVERRKTVWWWEKG
jgi:hypothetical protein